MRFLFGINSSKVYCKSFLISYLYENVIVLIVAKCIVNPVDMLKGAIELSY